MLSNSSKSDLVIRKKFLNESPSFNKSSFCIHIFIYLYNGPAEKMNIFVNEISLQFRDFYLDELSKTEKLQLYTSKQHVAFSRQLT